MNVEDRIKRLEEEITSLKYQVRAQQSIISLNRVPDWAINAFDAAIKSGLKESPVGNGYDFFLIIDLLHKKEVL